MKKNETKTSNQFSLDEISSQILNAISAEPFFNKETLHPRIRAILSAFIKVNNEPNPNKPLTDKDRLRYIKQINENKIDIAFWKRIVRNLDPENMETHYLTLDKARENGKLSQ